MIEILALLSLMAALVLLGFLAVIDLKERLLPNVLVAPFAICGLVFHLSLSFDYLTPVDMAFGALIGGGILYAIRMIAIKFYGPDALGLGDVKLMGAAGIWLGPYTILIALTLGALAGLLHGLAVFAHTWFKKKIITNLNTLSIPAGPGFIVGIVAAAMIEFQDLLSILFP